MKSKKNFFNKISEFFKKVFGHSDSSVLSHDGIYVKNNEIVNVNQVRG
jgi:hypothetical protein